ncbi:MAG TPA: hypothetical protein PLU72_16855 [Candidatus Ozemobacteraceae bacterium]|nr:hypothetical protein [Candidatus Ozemobacteraceae bacterium]HQG27485.1 hypothetical protein [Candidatus Ozemobacteraceae bacterium]
MKIAEASGHPIVAAPSPTDAGFRQAYLELVCRRARPFLYRIFRLQRPFAGSNAEIRPGYAVATKAVERMIRREGAGFLCGSDAAEGSRRWAGWRNAWSEYREALLRNGDASTPERMWIRADRLRQTLYSE